MENTEGRKTSVAVYQGVDGNPLETKLVENITQFQAKKRKGTLKLSQIESSFHVKNENHQ